MARPRGVTKTELVSMRISAETAQIWEEVARQLGISKVGAFEQAIRKLAKNEGIQLPKTPESGKTHQEEAES